MALKQATIVRLSMGCALAAALLLTACADGVDLNGKLFDTLGVSPAAQAARKFEPTIAERAPLVVPPDSGRLPEPGSAPAPTQVAWPDDPEQRKIREAKERERLHQSYCSGDAQWKERAMTKEAGGAPRSPYGPCGSVFGSINTNVNKE
jgi:hypothetical protein